MLKKEFICMILALLVVVFGCANQQNESGEIAVEEISLTVSGMV